MAWEFYDIDYTHEFENNGISYTSTIDHILWNETLRNKISNSGVLHLLNNTSDHSPIYCDMNKTISSNKESIKGYNGKNGVNTKSMNTDDWDNFHKDLKSRLESIVIPECASCRNIHCNDKGHKDHIDSYVENVLEAVDASINLVAGGKRENKKDKKIIPGWNDIVQPFHDDAEFWNAVWKSAGKPLNNSLHTIMKRTRNIYHYAIRKCKRASEYLKKEKMLNSCVSGDNNIFDEIRKMRKTSNNAPNKIDGNECPAKKFGEVYGALYNSANDTEEMKGILAEINSSLDERDLSDVDKVSCDVISEAVKGIKSR